MLNRYIRQLVPAVMLTSLLDAAGGFSTGAGSSSCRSMVPRHFGAVPNAAPDPAPFVITVSRNEYRPGDSINVTIADTRNGTFKGFLIQARLDNASGNNDLYGTFQVKEDHLTTLRCGREDQDGEEHNAITHTALRKGYAVRRRNVTVTWIAPKQYIGDIRFHVTVVEWFRSVWIGYTSDLVKGLEDSVETETPPAEREPETPTATPTPETKAPTTKETERTTLETTTAPPSTEGPSQVDQTTPSKGDKPPSGGDRGDQEEDEGRPSGEVPPTERPLQEEGRQQPSSGGEGEGANRTREVVPERRSSPQPGCTWQPAKLVSDQISTMDCGIEKGCYRYPPDCIDPICQALMAWKDRDDHIEFEVMARTAVNQDLGWVGVGFSKSDTLGDDSIITCTYRNGSSADEHEEGLGEISVCNVYRGKDGPSQLIGDYGLTRTEGYVVKEGRGVHLMRCRFTRSKWVPQNPDRIFFLRHDPFYLTLIAGVAAKDGTIGEEFEEPKYSPLAVKLDWHIDVQDRPLLP